MAAFNDLAFGGLPSSSQPEAARAGLGVSAGGQPRAPVWFCHACGHETTVQMVGTRRVCRSCGGDNVSRNELDDDDDDVDGVQGAAAQQDHNALFRQMRFIADAFGGPGPGGVQLGDAQVDVDELMNRLLQEPSRRAPPTSKQFMRELKVKKLTQRDFVSVHLRAITGKTVMHVPLTCAEFGFDTIGRHVDEFKQDNSSRSGGVAAQEGEEDEQAAKKIRSNNNSNNSNSNNDNNDNKNNQDEEPEPAVDTKTIVHLEDLPLVVCEPLTGKDAKPATEDAWRGKMVVMKRGAITFANKARVAQQHGAQALLVVQTTDVWPYTMTDSSGKHDDISLPSLMISQDDGNRLLDYAMSVDSSNTQPAVRVESVCTSTRALACPVCRDTLHVGSETLTLPCFHYFCPECIEPWLKERNTCPLCRYELPTEEGKNPAKEAAHVRQQLHNAMFQ
eukprot:TRINITY_DN67476_c0_g1_i1.p1 TRINITY_DN67476_c0_g1~~TRINITY_DN67476_c0_g1_i1.p1  ORF type:complete len:447 (-),score=193.71 TRINITY_DN67476_c0_g1_i1:121-1461(-)